MEIREAEVNDIEALVEMEGKYFVNPWTKEQFTYEIRENEFSKTLIILENGVLAGYVSYWILFDHGEVNKICVEEAYRRKGYATKLLDLAFDDFKAQECLSISLEVRVSNIGAQKLYEKYGFKTILTKKGYYSDGEDAYYMIKGAY